MPPIQCVKLRQKISDFGSASTSLKIDAPVVVKPETVSKSASSKFGIAPVRKKGNEPKKLKTIQARPTEIRPSREPILLF